MSKGPESRLQARCVDWLKSQGIYHLNVYGSGMTGRGTPDIIACINGVFAAFELKTPTGRLSPAQEVKGARIVESGGRWFVPRSFEEFVDYVEQVRKEVERSGP